MKIAVGDIVIDDLTGKKAKVIKILSATGLILDSDYMDGYRFSWEVTELIE